MSANALYAGALSSTPEASMSQGALILQQVLLKFRNRDDLV